MRRVFKYPLTNQRDGVLAIHRDAVIRHVHAQGDAICLWAEIDDQRALEMREFVVVGTGHEVSSDLAYVGTAHMPPFVWHVYERITR